MKVAQKIAFGDMPSDQRFSFKITPLPGRLINIETAGNTLVQLGKIFSTLGQDIEPRSKWFTGIAGMEMEADGALRFDIVVLPKRPDKDKEAT